MALSEVTTTFNLHDYFGDDFDPRRAKAYATNTADDQTIEDTSTGETRVGSGNAVIAADGTGTFTHWAPGPDANPASWQTTYHIDVADRNAPGGRRKVSRGPFTVTASGLLTDLTEEQYVPPTYLSTVTDLLDGYVDSASAAATAAAASATSAAASAELAGGGGTATDHGSESGTLSVGAGSHEMDLTGDLAVTVTSDRDVTLFAHGTGETLTVAGVDFIVDGDAVILVITSPRGEQQAFLAGAGSTEPSDTTPPSAITDLTATGGEETLTISWSARTDAESTVHYRYRYYLTSAGSSGVAWINTDAVSHELDEIPAGAYTVEAYAYSAGGASTADTATATVTAAPGWSVLASDDFNAANGTKIKDRPLPVGGISWGSGSDTAPEIQSNKMVWASPTEDAGVVLPLVAAGSALGVELSFDYSLAVQVNTSVPYIEITFPNTPNFRIDMASGGAVTTRVFGTTAGGSAGQNLTTPVSVPATGRLGFRRIDDLLEIIDSAGTVIATHDLTGGYSSYYPDKPTPNTVTIIGYKFRTSSIDNLQVRVLT